MIGIYLITNKVNGKKYVGQSIDITRRYSEHLRSGQPEKYSHKNDRDINTPIHRAMQKYGVNNFSLTVLEECSKEQLNDKERYWIAQYKTNIKQYGYNLTKGGQENIGVKGELHSQAKLTQKEVDNIKYMLKYDLDKTIENIIEIYPFISKSTISLINTGKTWHDDNEQYPLRVFHSQRGSANGRAKFTEEQVMEIRTKYSQGIGPSALVAEYGHIASDNAIYSIIYGKTYKHLPIWNKKTQQWIEPCIDYPQSLK